MLRSFKQKIRTNRTLYRMVSPFVGIRHNWAMLKPRLTKGIDRNLVVFSAFQMRTYSDNPRYISEALHAMRPETDIVWLFRDPKAAKAKYAIPDYVRCLPFPTKESSEAAGRAAVLVDNFRKRDFLRLGKKQYYIYSPHYDRFFKRGVFDNPDFFYKRVVEQHCSLGVIGSEFHERIFRSAYRYKGPFLFEGSPRNDLLVNGDDALAARVRRSLNIPDGARLLLYAPTYRDADVSAARAQDVALDLPHVLDVLRETTGENWLCLYRAHYFAKGLALSDVDARMIDATAYPEMAELMLIADALISDYSSCAGDFALTGRPIWLYQADIEDYRSNSRLLYFDMADTPYWTASTPEAMDQLIRRTTPEAARENDRAILDFYGTKETGEAAKRVAEVIAKHLV